MSGPPRRGELADFLRSRRARLSPGQVGLPAGGPRRTPGLRREEVAHLAEVGVTWYTFLEQGRPISVSADVLERISGALRLPPMEVDHLFALAERHRAQAGWDEQVPPVVSALLDGAGAVPMHVLTVRFDIVGWNEAFRRVWFDPSTLAGDARNLVWATMTTERLHTLLDDWESYARQLLARFRFSFGQHKDDPRFTDLIARCDEASPRFRAWWAEHDVVFQPAETVVLQHPEAGRMELQTASFHPDPAPTLAVVADVPRAGTGTAERIARLLTRPAA